MKRTGILFALVSLLLSLIQNPARAALYTFTSHTFTNCNTTGISGPALSACTSAYSSASWTSSTSNFNVQNGIQLWTVPQTGSYSITSAGAGGGKSGYAAGSGVIIRASYNLTQGDVIQILVGQTGDTQTSSAGGGGGGSFIYDSTTATLLQVSGGGGGAGNLIAGENASTTNNGVKPVHGSYGGTTTGGAMGAENYTGGGGGGSNSGANGTDGTNGGGLGGGGGAGYGGNGGAGQNWSGTVAKSFLSGGNGGYRTTYGTLTSGYGGFGGGGPGCTLSYIAGGGGGGGYAGGGGGTGSGTGGGGGGGGSYISGTSQNLSLGTNLGNGYVTISSENNPTAFSIGVSNTTSKRLSTVITATINTPPSGGDGKITFYQNGRQIAGCVNLNSSSNIATCYWKPITHGSVLLTARLSPSNSSYTSSTSPPISVTVSPRGVSRS